MSRELPKVYDPSAVEHRNYQKWEESGYFTGVVDWDKKPFSIVIPPPNVTGKLHLGHAFDNTLQDVLARTKRMQGYSVLWQPGTDHAGIATQIKVEEELRKQGKTRYDYGREKFLDLVWEWKKEYGGNIIKQLKTLGSSCDWSRERFTMDEGCSRAVREVFVNLYKKDLIYKGNRIINWCPKCTTALSDAEVVYEEQPGFFWHIRYPIVGEKDRYITVATTRPETMLGDSAIAVHPEDERYKDLVGKKCILPLVGREIPIVADEYVDREFGTGCVKITPCHDPNDFEVGKRHQLEEILVIDGNGRINANGGKYEGLDRYEARKQIVRDLEEGGYLIKTEPHTHNVGTCYRCGTTVEPMASAQWFVRMKPLAEPAIRVVKEGEIRFVPERFSKTYLNWMENVHDWCISRQLWWGHRIPAFYCEDCGATIVEKEDPTECPHCHSKRLKQDEDVLDTWFSSALWPFETLGWPDQTEELKYFYPTTTLVTGYDIIFFWVARMIFSGLEHTGKVPFHTVVLHGIIRDSQGRKMSKSLGNGVDPMDVIEKYGADALRFTIVTGNSPGNDMRFYDERCEAMRNFCNKIWNASRFVLMNLGDDTLPEGLPEKLLREDEWILSKYEDLVAQVTENIEKYELGIAAKKLYDFIWDYFCDWYIELTKPRLQGSKEEKESALQVLTFVLSNTLKLLHPFMPFITEEIWQALPHEGESIMVSAWPQVDEKLIFAESERAMQAVMDAIVAVRARRAEMNVPPSKKAHMLIVTKEQELFTDGKAFLLKLAYGSDLTVTDQEPENSDGYVTATTDRAQIYLPMSELVDLEKEAARIKKEIEKNTAELKRLEGKLSNPGFLTKAPEAVVQQEKDRAEKLKGYLENLSKSLESLK